MTAIAGDYDNSDVISFCDGMVKAILHVSQKHTETPFKSIIPATVCELSRVLNYHKKLELVKEIDLRWFRTCAKEE